MAEDKYKNFKALAAGEDESSYRIVSEDRGNDLLIIAPHGGKIERGTTEIAKGVAGLDWSFYTFEGLKPAGNRDAATKPTEAGLCDGVAALYKAGWLDQYPAKEDDPNAGGD